MEAALLRKKKEKTRRERTERARALGTMEKVTENKVFGDLV